METVNNNDQMDMMSMMMMQPPDFSGAYGDICAVASSFPPLEFSDAANSTTTSNTTHNSTMPLVDLIDNPPMPWSSPSFTHLPSTTNTISFSNNPTTVMLQEQGQTPTLAALLSNSRVDSWRTTAAATEGLLGCAKVGSEKRNSMAAMREMIFRIAAMQPIHIDPESVKAPKRRNVKISKDPQSVAARHRRERISERIRILQRLVPGGTKMDTASMLDEAIHYVKFLQTQVQSLERANTRPSSAAAEIGLGFPVAMSSSSSRRRRRTTPTPDLPLPKPNYQAPIVEH